MLIKMLKIPSHTALKIFGNGNSKLKKSISQKCGKYELAENTYDAILHIFMLI